MSSKKTTKKDEAEDKKDDVAEKDSKETKEKDVKKSPAKKAKQPKRFGVASLVVTGVVALAVGVGAGILAYSNMPVAGSPATFADTLTLTEDQLDTVMGTYTYKGTTYEFTVEDLILENSSIEAAQNEDGTYDVPTADTAISHVRYQIIEREAEDLGITVSDEDVSQYAIDTLGSDDYATIASTYSMTEDQVEMLMRQSAIMKAVHDQVVGEEAPELPTAPNTPAEGEEDAATQEYADYVIALLGDEWDAENNTWARTDGDYYASLSTYTISNDSATYDAASAAYNVAYLQYQTEYLEYTNAWTDYVNGLLSNATIDIYTLVS